MCVLLSHSQSFVKADPRDVVLGPNATSLLNAVVLSATYNHHQHSRSSGSSSSSRGSLGAMDKHEGDSSSPQLSVPLELKPGDQIMLFDTTYGGVKKLCAEACRRTGATLEIVPMPHLPLDEVDSTPTTAALAPAAAASEVASSSENNAATDTTNTAAAIADTMASSKQVLPSSAPAASAATVAATAACVDLVSEHVRASQGRTALVVLDHTTSNTALTLPVAAMARAAKEAGAKCVLVDGAHGVWAQVSDVVERTY